MKSFQFKNIAPHLIAILVFLVITFIFCKPALESGVVMKQGDATSWQGMAQQSLEYEKVHGHLPLWNTNMFGGMPNYQIAMKGDWSPLSILNSVFQLGLPQPYNFFFLACICFYFLCICLGVRPFAAIIGAIGFAFCSYSPIIVTAGHATKMLALAYAPAVMGAVVLVFKRKYLWGFTLTALLTNFQIAQGHQQISYYLFLILGAMVISYFVQFVKSKETSHFFKSIGLIAIAGVLGVATNALSLNTTYDFSKESKRGGQLIIDDKKTDKDALSNGKTTGLTKDYAFMWSYGKAETWSLMFPGVVGYGSHQAERDGEYYVFPKIKEDGKLINYLNEEMPQFPADQIASQMSGALYWGTQPFTNGPVYLGAITCFLFLLGMFCLDGKHKWWILGISILAVLLSWGDNFASFNYFVFDHLPLYNKFRAPAMILVVPQLLFPLLGSLVLNQFMNDENELNWNHFKKALIGTAAVFFLILGFYFSTDFGNENRQRTNAFNTIVNSNSPDINQKLSALNADPAYKSVIDNQIYEGMYSNLRQASDANATSKARGFVNALHQERASLLMNDIIRSLILVLIADGLIALYLKKKINVIIMIAGLTLCSTIDLLQFGMNYLNDKNFTLKSDFETEEFPKSNADITILNDKDPNFRVMNTSSLEESKTSYYHKSIGGYHPAKIGIYDDLMAYQLSRNTNMNVINMLNTKYFIQQQGDNKIANLNPMALGNVWFVKGIKYVNGPTEEMKALNNFNPSDTAIVDNTFKSKIKSYSIADSTASIKQTTFDNDAITYQSKSNTDNIAVFSEIYYKDWKAYIDGKPADFFKANYVLRAMVIPAGKHNIEFKFEPASYYQGKMIANISSWLLILLLLGSIFSSVLMMKKKTSN